MFGRFRPVLVVMVALAPAIGFGQSATGFIAGVVRDSSGGAIPGATIRIVGAAANASAEAISDEQGAYRSEPLVVGTYRVEIALDGFDTATRDVVVELGQVVSANFTLEPARLTEAVS